MPFQDKKLVCKQCSQEFIFTAGEQEFYAQRGFTHEPKRCKSCRPLKRISQSGYNKNYLRQLFDAVCAKCGKETQIPFKPMEGRLVYCRICYQSMKKL